MLVQFMINVCGASVSVLILHSSHWFFIWRKFQIVIHLARLFLQAEIFHRIAMVLWAHQIVSLIFSLHSGLKHVFGRPTKLGLDL